MNTKALSPIGISTYKRTNHIKRTIEALKLNLLSKYSKLYIFSDAPKKGDEEEVHGLRKYVRTITGFESISIIERETNNRTYNNRMGLKYLLEEYGKVIWLEEDIITTGGFLSFMNDALNYYKDDENILSITGYCPPIKIRKMTRSDVFALRRFNAWGFATWGSKFDPYSFEIDPIESRKKMKQLRFLHRLNENGKDIPRMIKKEISHQIDALDVKVMYYQNFHDMYTIYPVQSLVKNIGHDGTGIHCGNSTRFDVDLWTKTHNFSFEKNIRPEKKIVKENYKFRSNGVKDIIIDILDFLRIYNVIKALKVKILS